MKRLKLNILALVPQQIHHHLQIPLIRDVPRHHAEVRPVEQDLAQKLEGLPFGDVVRREDEGGEGCEELEEGGVLGRERVENEDVNITKWD